MKTHGLVFLVLASMAAAHTVFLQVELKVGNNWVMQKKGDGVRYPLHLNSPIKLPPSPTFQFLPCNGGENVLNKPDRIIEVTAGDQVRAIWRIEERTQGSSPDEIIDKSHKGPLLAYMKKVQNAKTDQGSGDGWFKIQEDGLVNGQWAVDRLRNEQGKQKIIIPACIEPGQYLLRAELIALHEGAQSGGPQFYMACAQLQVKAKPGAVAQVKPALIDLNQVYNATVPGLKFDIYNQPKSYPIPGGALLKCKKDLY